MGKTKAGKSTFIRKALNYPRGDPTAPKSGPLKKHRTSDKDTYERPSELTGVRMTDAMGIGYGAMKGIKPEEYCKRLRLHEYDAILFMSSCIFDEEELALYKFVKKLGKPCFLVVSHFDEAVIAEHESNASMTMQQAA